MDILDYKFRNLNKLFTFKENRAVRTACPVLFKIGIPCGTDRRKSKKQAGDRLPKNSTEIYRCIQDAMKCKARPQKEITGGHKIEISDNIKWQTDRVAP